MSDDVEREQRCSGCGHVLLPDHTGPCPHCGATARDLSISASETVQVTDWLGVRTVREAYETNRLLLAVVVLITFGSPFLGLVLAGVPGVVAGLVLSALTYVLGPKAIIRVRDTSEWHGP